LSAAFSGTRYINAATWALFGWREVEPAAVFTCRGAQVPFEVRASMDNRAIGGGADLFGNKTSYAGTLRNREKAAAADLYISAANQEVKHYLYLRN